MTHTLAVTLPGWLAAPASSDPLASALSVSVTLVLASAIAWLHRHTARGAGHTQDYSHTLVIIAVVTTALIAVVSGSMSIGVAMFAAFSLIRFPSNFGRSMDLAFAFFAIAVGMVSGSGHHLAALLVTVVGGCVVLLLHSRDAFAPERSTHLLTVSLASDADFETILAPVFADHTTETRLLSTLAQADSNRTLIRYGLVLKQGTGLPLLVEALHHVCGNHRILLEPTDHAFDIER